MQRLRFNLFRLYLKPEIDVLLSSCSKKISTILGDYVLIDDTKYLFISNHLVTESRKPAYKDCDKIDYDIFISSSIEDLIHLKKYLD